MFTVLGINMDLSQSRTGKVVISNKPDRVQTLIATAGDLCKRERVERGEAASLHGQLNFAQGQYIGSELKPVMSLFSSIAAEGWNDSRKDELKIAAAYMVQVLTSAAPKFGQRPSIKQKEKENVKCVTFLLSPRVCVSEV